MEKPSMTCKQAQTCIQPFIDRTMSLQRTGIYLEHVRNCRDCMEDLEINYTVQLGLALLDHEDPEKEANLLEALKTDMNEREQRYRKMIEIQTLRRISILVLSLLLIYEMIAFWFGLPKIGF